MQHRTRTSSYVPLLPALAAPIVTSQLRVTLFAPTRHQLARLAELVDGQPGLCVGPRLLLDACAAEAPPLLTPLGLLDLRDFAPQALISLLSDPGLLSRPRPCLVALATADDLLRQRLVRAAPLAVSAVGPSTVDPGTLAIALRFVAAPGLTGCSQLWFGGLNQPPAPYLDRGQRDLQLLALLRRNGKLAETAAQLGYTRRSLQCQLAGLCQRLSVTRTPGRQSTIALADTILAALH